MFRRTHCCRARSILISQGVIKTFSEDIRGRLMLWGRVAMLSMCEIVQEIEEYMANFAMQS